MMKYQYCTFTEYQHWATSTPNVLLNLLQEKTWESTRASIMVACDYGSSCSNVPSSNAVF